MKNIMANLEVNKFNVYMLLAAIDGMMTPMEFVTYTELAKKSSSIIISEDENELSLFTQGPRDRDTYLLSKNVSEIREVRFREIVTSFIEGKSKKMKVMSTDTWVKKVEDVTRLIDDVEVKARLTDFVNEIDKPINVTENDSEKIFVVTDPELFHKDFTTKWKSFFGNDITPEWYDNNKGLIPNVLSGTKLPIDEMKDVLKDAIPESLSADEIDDAMGRIFNSARTWKSRSKNPEPRQETHGTLLDYIERKSASEKIILPELGEARKKICELQIAIADEAIKYLNNPTAYKAETDSRYELNVELPYSKRYYIYKDRLCGCRVVKEELDV